MFTFLLKVSYREGKGSYSMPIRGLLIGCLGLLWGAAAYAQTLEQAIDVALAGNPDLAIESQNLNVAVETLRTARGSRLPSVTFTGSGGYQSIDSTSPLSFNEGERPFATAELQAVQPLFTSGRISGGVTQALAGKSAAELQYEALRQDLILDVISAYEGVRRDRESITISQNNVALLSEQVQAAIDRFDVGVVTRTDVKLAEARYAAAQARLASAQASLEGSLAEFTRLVGYEPEADLPAPPPLPVLPETLEDALSQALSGNPDLAAARYNHTASQAGVDVARGEKGLQLSLVGTASVQQTYSDDTICLGAPPECGGTGPIINSDPRDTTLTALLQATIPLYQGGQLNSAVRSARHRRAQARLGVDSAERAVRSGLSQAWFGFIAAQQNVVASSAQVDAAQIAYEGAQEELSVGVRSTLDVLDQEQELFDARLALIDAERDAYVTAHQVLRFMGRLTSDD